MYSKVSQGRRLVIMPNLIVHDVECLRQCGFCATLDCSAPFLSALRAGKLRAKVDLGDREVNVRCADKTFTVRHLPPIDLEFLLTEKYPSELSPIFKIRSEWLSSQQVTFLDSYTGWLVETLELISNSF